jgi:succinate-semialdehyde dehydrogenase/glutarate-semialdehyde dehydrogenase
VANDTRFGLGGSVWTGDPARGERFAQRMAMRRGVRQRHRQERRAAAVRRQQAVGFGRELADHGIREFMNIKTVYVA